jgi:hypothetical protein
MAILIGTAVESTQEFRDRDGNLHDPATVTLTVRSPSGTKTAFVYLTDPEVVRLSLGVYAFRHIPDAAGEWGYHWAGTGDDAYTEEGFVSITASRVLA